VVAELRRLFLAVAVDPQLKSMLAQHLALWTVPGKVVPPDNWHLTIRFLGSIDQIRLEMLTALLDGADLGPPFDLVVGEMGSFPQSDRANVLWLGVEDRTQGLARLNSVTEDACRQCGLPSEERPFAAHLTLSRLRPPENVGDLIESYDAQRFRWTVDELTLFESKPGPRYEEVDRFRLRKSQAPSRR
jgi:RNA 2',3'-cyclic 3'-phosphodiesterase